MDVFLACILSCLSVASLFFFFFFFFLRKRGFKKKPHSKCFFCFFQIKKAALMSPIKKNAALALSDLSLNKIGLNDWRGFFVVFFVKNFLRLAGSEYFLPGHE